MARTVDLYGFFSGRNQIEIERGLFPTTRIILSEDFMRGGWPGFQTAEATIAADASCFAYFAKGGYDDGVHNG